LVNVFAACRIKAAGALTELVKVCDLTRDVAAVAGAATELRSVLANCHEITAGTLAALVSVLAS
jgi:hypothetical protein